MSMGVSGTFGWLTLVWGTEAQSRLKPEILEVRLNPLSEQFLLIH